jgi:CubicO group peptidase (beta-lactamase class C family)
MKSPGSRIRPWAVAALVSGISIAALEAEPRGAAGPSGTPDLKQALTELIRHEMEDKGIPALSIAVVEDQELVWAEGFGMADPARDIRATPRTLYRVGSVSKLFTDIGIMQLVERGEVDLDASITTYLPEFRPDNPFSEKITLRQLMSHRSGLIREPPLGHYFDDAEPTLADTVASLDGAQIVYSPGSRTKYSNAGIAVVGFVLERLGGEPFARQLKRGVLDPMGMQTSAFEPSPEIRRDLAKAFMWSYDGRRFEAPSFELGMSPAGSMYSSVLDLARFLRVLFDDGRGPGGQVIRPETLAKMFTPQYPEEDGRRQFGIGFAIDELEGHRRLGHGGAIYGFATALSFLPDSKIGVAVTSTLDCSNTVTNHVAEQALRLMLGASGSRSARPSPASRPVDPATPAGASARSRFSSRAAHDRLR